MSLDPTQVTGFAAASIARTLVVLPLVVLLLLGPGFLPALAVARRCRLTFAEALPLSLAITVAFVGIGGWAAWLAGGTLRTALVLVAALAVAASVVLVLRGERPWIRPVGRVAAITIGVAALASLVGGAWLGFHGDVFFHLAAPRALLATNAPLVTDPLYGTANLGPDPTAGIWHTVLALLSLATTIDVVTLWFAVSVVVAALVVAAFFALCRSVSGSPASAVVGVVLLFALNGFDFRSAAYPNMTARIFLFTAMLYFVLIARGSGRAAVTGAAAGGTAAIFMHMAFTQMTYVFVALACMAALIGTWLARRAFPDRSWAPFLQTVIASGAIVLVTAPSVFVRARSVVGSWMTDPSGYSLPSAFPNLPKLGILFPGVGLRLPDSLASALNLVVGVAMITLLLMMVVAAFRDRQPERFVHVAVAGTSFLLYQFPPVTLAGLAVAPYVLYRLQALTAYARPIQVSWALGPNSQPVRAARWVGYIMLGVMLALAVPTAAQRWLGIESVARPEPTIVESWSKDVRRVWGGSAIAQVRRIAGSTYPRVGSDAVTGYELAGIAPVTALWVPETHNPLAILATTAKAREAASKRLMDPTLTESERLKIARDWDLDYIAVSHETKQRAELLAALKAQPAFEPVLETRRLSLFKVEPR